MAHLTVIRELNAAHGTNIHGHTFRVEIEFKGKLINHMVAGIDFHDVSTSIHQVLDQLDKTYLDEVLGVKGTVENIAIFIIRHLKKVPNLEAVTVWEGNDKYVKIEAKEVSMHD